MAKSERSIDQLLDEAAADAEAGDGVDAYGDIPAHVKVTRGGPRTRVLQVRLNDDELAALELRAEFRGLPASTVVRELILNALDPAPAQAAARQRIIAELMHYLDTVNTEPPAKPRQTARPRRVADKPRRRAGHRVGD
jgi:hypothetical protein